MNVRLFFTTANICRETSNMVLTCVAYKCSNRQKSGSGVSFHRFPDEKKRSECRAAWICAIRRKDWAPTKNSFLCSDHFEQNCFVVRPNKIGRRLNDSAVPSIFNFPLTLPSKDQLKKPRKQLAEAPLDWSDLCQSEENQHRINAAEAVGNRSHSSHPDEHQPKKLPAETPESSNSLSQPEDCKPSKVRKQPIEVSGGQTATAAEDQELQGVDKLTRRLKTEHSYVSRSEPEMVKKTAVMRRTIKTLNQKVRRKQKKISQMTDLLKSIEEQDLVDIDELALLRNTFGRTMNNIPEDIH